MKDQKNGKWGKETGVEVLPAWAAFDCQQIFSLNQAQTHDYYWSLEYPSRTLRKFLQILIMKEYYYCIVMLNTKGQNSDILLETKPKGFGIVSEFVQMRTDCFDLFQPESALLDQTEMFSFDGTDSAMNSDVLVSFLLDVGTFVERLFLYCFHITTFIQQSRIHMFSSYRKDKRPSNQKEEVQRRLETIERVLETEQVLKG